LQCNPVSLDLLDSSYTIIDFDGVVDRSLTFSARNLACLCGSSLTGAKA